MKKILLLLLVIIPTIAYCDNITWLTATNISIRIKNYGEWTDWSDWKRTNIKVKIDFNSDKITILSEDIQIYRILSRGEEIYDPSGTSIDFDVIDQDGDKGTVRIRKQNDGVFQLYIFFRDISWVYVLE